MCLFVFVCVFLCVRESHAAMLKPAPFQLQVDFFIEGSCSLIINRSTNQSIRVNQSICDLLGTKCDFWLQLEDQVKQVEERKSGKDKEKESLEEQVKKLMEGKIAKYL